jgi:hypothetical protein
LWEPAGKRFDKLSVSGVVVDKGRFEAMFR